MQAEISKTIGATGKARGGKARTNLMSKEQRTELAKKAAASRWAVTLETVAGSKDTPLRLLDKEIECYVLTDGTRVITQGSMLNAIGRKSRQGGRGGAFNDLPPILHFQALQGYLTPELIDRARPIRFRIGNGPLANGYRAELLPEFCELFLRARDDGKLASRQATIAQTADALMRSLAKVGIVALVDEATGYQDARAKNALAQLLEAYVAKEIQRWVRTFPQDYYKQLFRLRDLDFDPANVKRPRFFGTLTNNIVYDRLAPGVREELKKAQKKSEKSGKMHQHLTGDVGHPALREHLGSVVTIMKLSDNWESFKRTLDRIHPRYDQQPQLWADEKFDL